MVRKTDQLPFVSSRAATPFSDSWYHPAYPPSHSGAWNSRAYSPLGGGAGSYCASSNADSRTRTASGKSRCSCCVAGGTQYQHQGRLCEKSRFYPVCPCKCQEHGYLRLRELSHSSSRLKQCLQTALRSSLPACSCLQMANSESTKL